MLFTEATTSVRASLPIKNSSEPRSYPLRMVSISPVLFKDVQANEALTDSTAKETVVVDV